MSEDKKGRGKNKPFFVRINGGRVIQTRTMGALYKHLIETTDIKRLDENETAQIVAAGVEYENLVEENQDGV